PGLFELADNGTILLDEIGELPLHVQPKLLRVIQEREVQRLGDKTSIPVDFRLLAATNRELKNDVLEGKFREDLFYRLNVVPINIPPLRERQEDILEIAAYYMKKLNKKYKKNVRVTSEVEDALLNYSWPGNVRELENLVEYLFIVNINDLITIESLPSWVLTEHIMKNSNLELHNSIPRLKYILDMYEKNIITVALSKHSSVKDTAETLDVHPSTLFRKIKKLKIETNLE
ncbi:MAG: sigma 54-interacting transcriptional regulator, partial [Tissierellia bacterium]|nr:sigma 54-interacting transcriptional regulator [Tissierellia bacterium]